MLPNFAIGTIFEASSLRPSRCCTAPLLLSPSIHLFHFASCSLCSVCRKTRCLHIIFTFLVPDVSEEDVFRVCRVRGNDECNQDIEDSQEERMLGDDDDEDVHHPDLEEGGGEEADIEFPLSWGRHLGDREE